MLGRIIAVILIVVAAGAGFYAGRLNGISAGAANSQRAQNQFFAARGGNGGNFGGGAGGNGTRQRNGANGGDSVFGTVDSINGNVLTVKMRDNTTAQVQINADAQIRTTVDGKVSDIKTGDRVVALGTKTGTVLQAASIQLGGGGFGFGGGGQGGQGGGQQGQGGGQQGQSNQTGGQATTP